MIAKKFFKYILFAGCFFIICFSSCLERIDISTEASPPRLVIYGYITTDTTRHEIRITRSSGFFETTKPEGISNANVIISYDEGSFELRESAEEPGLYLTSRDAFGVPGKTYTLHASLDFDGDGKPEDYEATSFLPFPATLDSIAITTSYFMDDLLQVLVWGNLPEESSNNFSFNLLRNGVVLNDSLRNMYIVQDDYIINNKIEAMPIFQINPEREKYNFQTGDTIAVRVGSVTSEYATFIQNAQQEARGSIPLFSGPPANLETNLRCLSPNSKTGLSGFFTAYSKHSADTIFERK